jgi:hypothetical protein
VREHSLEMQLPFLRRVLPALPIVPVLIGYQRRATIEALAAAIVSAFTGRSVLLVASTDLSHYFDAATAANLDARVQRCVEAFDPEALLVDEPSPTPVAVPAPDVPEPAVREPRAPRSRRVRGALLLLIPLILIVGLACSAPSVGTHGSRTTSATTTVRSSSSRASRWRARLEPDGRAAPASTTSTTWTSSRARRSPRSRATAERYCRPGGSGRAEHDHHDVDDHDDDHHGPPPTTRRPHRSALRP